ncbi:protein ROLLING AND ERECT LEAF 2-like [Zingiber officinale]|uniref:Uncharacterized protein n=1 Tax=Zingiber officinale TaxID=94328 RepID=A0A8J5FQK5_ZINOF|nr:protein ROLLING AND ERECT LEAF 2-like [Zingiber officinale]KAG6493993.1 hypothetical protein ZIOFF_049006 [Zingiber officinale]
MGVTNSKIEEEKALVLCRERKRFVRHAIDERCLLADSHFSYVQSLRNTGIALRNFVEPEFPAESSMYTSTDATPEPLALTEKAVSHFSNSSPSISQRLDATESFPPIPSPLSSGRIHLNHMKSGKTSDLTVKEKLPTSVTATLESSINTSKHVVSELDEISSFEASPTPPTAQRWDYFGLFDPIGNQLSFESGRGLDHGFDNADEIGRLREEEGIPNLEEDEDRDSTNEKIDLESEDDFDQTTKEPLVQIFKNKNVILEQQLRSESPAILAAKDTVSEGNHKDEDNVKLTNGISETYKIPETARTKAAPQVAVFPINGKAQKSESVANHETKDFVSCIKEIQELFLNACESGIEVPRMLEANKVQFQPPFPEEKAYKTKASVFLTSCFTCIEDAPHPPVAAENDMKYITWHRSMSSLSSSSRRFVGPAANSDIDDLSSSNIFHSYMNSGSHASTLDRLYAWERKLYDEVKASGVIRREYDLKCKLLRHKESVEDNRIKIDKIRASVKDLHSRIRVAIQRIGSISKKIEEIRDKELQPQLEELIGGLIRMWRMMRDYHSRQYDIILLASNNRTTKVAVRSAPQHHVMSLLYELNSLSSNFSQWMSAHKSYLTAINGWLHKCIDLSQKHGRSSRKKPQPFSPMRHIAPPIFMTCKIWLLLLHDLPTKEVVSSIKDMVNVLSHFLPTQEKDHGTPRSTFSLPREAVKGRLGENNHPNPSFPVDWSLNYDQLQSALTIFLDRLRTFAEISATKYEELQTSVNLARDHYESSQFAS